MQVFPFDFDETPKFFFQFARFMIKSGLGGLLAELVRPLHHWKQLPTMYLRLHKTTQKSLLLNLMMPRVYL